MKTQYFFFSFFYIMTLLWSGVGFGEELYSEIKELKASLNNPYYVNGISYKIRTTEEKIKNECSGNTNAYKCQNLKAALESYRAQKLNLSKKLTTLENKAKEQNATKKSQPSKTPSNEEKIAQLEKDNANLQKEKEELVEKNSGLESVGPAPDKAKAASSEGEEPETFLDDKDRKAKIDAADNAAMAGENKSEDSKDSKTKRESGDAKHRKEIAKAYNAEKADVDAVSQGEEWKNKTESPDSPCKVGKQINKGKYGDCKTTTNTAMGGQISNFVADQGGALAVNAKGQQGLNSVQQNNGSQADVYDNMATTSDFASKVQGLKGIMNLGVAAFQWSNYFKHSKNKKELLKNSANGEEHLLDSKENPNDTIENGVASNKGEFKGKSTVTNEIIDQYHLNDSYTINKDCTNAKEGDEKNQCLKIRAEQYLGKAKGMGNDIREIGAAAAEEQEASKEVAKNSAMFHTGTGLVDMVGAYTYKKQAEQMREASNTLREIDNNTPTNVFGQDPVAPPESDYEENTNRTNETIKPTELGLSDNDASEEDSSDLSPPPPAGDVAEGMPEQAPIPFLPGVPVDGGGGVGGGGGGFGFGGTPSTGPSQESGESPTDPSFAERGKSASYSGSSNGGKRSSGGAGAGNKKAKAEENPFAQMLAQLLGKNEEKNGPENGILSFEGRSLASTEEDGSLLGQNVDLFDRVSKAYTSKVRDGSFVRR